MRPVSSAAPERPPGRWQPAIQEIEADHDALGRVFFERDDAMELELCHAYGLFFLDVETGSVEGWTWPEPILASPGNRFVYFPSDETPVLYDRLAERAYTWDPDETTLMLRGWGTGADERFVFGSGSDYAVVDASMRAVTSFEFTEVTGLPVGWAHPDGTHLLMRSAQTGGDTLYSIDLRAGIDAKMRTRTLPPTDRGSRIQVSSTGDGFAVISPSDDGTCSVERLDWTLSTLSDVSLPCDPWRGIDLSRDARLAATVLLSVGEAIEEPGLFSRLTTVSIFDAATGEERLRIKGALPSEALFGVHEGRTRWLSDGSGLVVDTREDTRIVRIEDRRVDVFPPDAHWWQGLLIPGPDRADRLDRPFELFLRYCADPEGEHGIDLDCRVLRARVVDDAGRELASARVMLRIVPGSSWDVTRQSVFDVAYNRTSWGLSSTELRMHLNLLGPYVSAGYRPALPFVVDRPPFVPLMSLEVAGDESCAHVREAPAREARSLACLAAGTVIEAVQSANDTDYGWPYQSPHIAGDWTHVGTADGAEGWVLIERLRWAQ